MKKSIPFWQMAGFVFVGIFGTILHFALDWSGGCPAFALFSAANESIWEHMKLLFYPMLVLSLVEYWRWGRQMDNFWCIKLTGILLGLALIPVIYYTYTGVLGVSADWFNITIFFLAAGVSLWVETKRFAAGKCRRCVGKWAIGALVLLIVAFTVLTFLPPHIPLFRDPLTDTYGFQG